MFLSILKSVIIYGGSGLLALGLATLIWVLWPISVNEDRPDPAVTLANEIGASDIPYTEGYVGEAGARTHYVSAGEGDVIIFAHGFPSYWFSMFGLMEALKSDFRVIAFDGLGVGHSDAPRDIQAYKLEHLVRSIEQLVDEAGAEQVHLVGHDFGVALVVAYAQAYPEKANSVTIMGALPHNVLLARLEHDEAHKERFSYTKTFNRANPVLIKILGVKESLWDATYKPLHEAGLLSDAQADRLKADIGNPKRLNRLIHWYRANLLDFENITEDDFWPSRDARLTVPSVFIYGDEDVVVTDPLVEDLTASSDALEVLKLEGVGHRPHYEAKATVVEAIRGVIARSERAP